MLHERRLAVALPQYRTYDELLIGERRDVTPRPLLLHSFVQGHEIIEPSARVEFAVLVLPCYQVGVERALL